jgi:hypothetical protein
LPALRSLVEAFAARTGIAATIEVPQQLPSLDERAELALFRAVQEALANVARHAAATKVAVRLANGAGRLALEVVDNGRGLPPDFDAARAERDGHLGLAGMRERVSALGGVLELGPPPVPQGAAGLTVRLTFPIGASPP